MAKKENKNENKLKKHFFKDFKAELKKVIWPTPKQLVNNTVAVVTIVLITAVIVFALDAIFDLGTILSFLAMLGIIFAGVVNDIYLVLPRSRLYKIKRSLFTSFYASGFVMIPILSTFGGVYILSPFSNLAGSIIFAPIMSAN